MSSYSFLFFLTFFSLVTFNSNQLGDVACCLTRVKKPFVAFKGLGMVFRIEAGPLVYLRLGTFCGGF